MVKFKIVIASMLLCVGLYLGYGVIAAVPTIIDYDPNMLQKQLDEFEDTSSEEFLVNLFYLGTLNEYYSALYDIMVRRVAIQGIISPVLIVGSVIYLRKIKVVEVDERIVYLM